METAIGIFTIASLGTAAIASTVSVLIGWHNWRRLKDTNEQIFELKKSLKKKEA
jgi:hypothetical protein